MFFLYASNVMIAIMLLTSIICAISILSNWTGTRLWIILIAAEFVLFVIFSLIYDSQSGRVAGEAAKAVLAYITTK